MAFNPDLMDNTFGGSAGNVDYCLQVGQPNDGKATILIVRYDGKENDGQALSTPIESEYAVALALCRCVSNDTNAGYVTVGGIDDFVELENKEFDELIEGVTDDQITALQDQLVHASVAS